MIPIYAMGTMLILLFCGLSLDVGLLRLKQLQMQSAADAGALGVNNVTVTVTWPSNYGDYNGFYDVMHVQITQSVRTIFMGAINGGMVTVSVHSGALMPPCAYLMTAAGLSGGYAFSGTNKQINNDAGTDLRCPVYANGNMTLDSVSNLDAYAINVTGSASGSSLLGSIFPPPRFNAQTMADPLAGLASPGFSAPCTKTAYTVTGGTATLSPGTYCGTSSKPGIVLQNATVTLNPGLYIVTGGVHWSNTTVNGTGITMFFTQGNGAGYGQVIFDSNSKVYISAPLDSSGGGIPTLLFFCDRNWVQTAAQDFKVDGALFAGDGIWYTTGTGISLLNAGSLYAPDYLAMVTDSLYNESSTLGLFSDFSMVPTGNPFRTRAVLVQ
jgi:hypothetical protein